MASIYISKWEDSPSAGSFKIETGLWDAGFPNMYKKIYGVGLTYKAANTITLVNNIQYTTDGGNTYTSFIGFVTPASSYSVLPASSNWISGVLTASGGDLKVTSFGVKFDLLASNNVEIRDIVYNYKVMNKEVK